MNTKGGHQMRDLEEGALQLPHSGTLSRAFLASGMLVTFKDVSYTVRSNFNKKEKVTLLREVSGFLHPGEMTALMGPSGSGKSTLLDILCSRKTVGTTSGEIKYAGTAPTKQFLHRFTGYVEQFDTLLGILTVEEMLLYQAELKRPMEQSWGEKKAAVDELIERLALGSCRHVRIGSVLARGISGGQAKRVNIGVALVTNPRVLFLDEPTSGLDSHTAREVMRVVGGLAANGMTIVSSVHSPTPFVFNLFDRLLLLLRGSTIYFGPPGRVAVDYFSSWCKSFSVVIEGESLAEWIAELTSQADCQGQVEEYAAVFASSELKRLADAEIERQLQQASSMSQEDQHDLNVKHDTVTPFWWSLKTLLKYRTLKSYRSPEFVGPRVGDKLFFSIIMFSVYWKVGDDLTPENAPNIMACLFMWTILAGFGAMTYSPALVLERPLFVRERNDGVYNVSTYLCAKMIEELSLAFLCSVAFANLVFWTLRLQGSFLLFWLVYLCSLFVGIVLAYFVASMSPTMEVAASVLPAYITSLLFFTGLLMRWEDIPQYWVWYATVNFLRYSWGSLMVNQFEGDRNVEVIQDIPVLIYYGLEGVDKWAWLAIEFAFGVFFLLCAFLALTYVRHERR